MAPQDPCPPGWGLGIRSGQIVQVTTGRWTHAIRKWPAPQPPARDSLPHRRRLPRPLPVPVHHAGSVLSPSTDEETGPQKGSRDLPRPVRRAAGCRARLLQPLAPAFPLLFRLRHPAFLHPGSPRLPLPTPGPTRVQKGPSAKLNTRHRQPHWHRTTEIINCKKAHRSNEARSCACVRRGKPTQATSVLATASPLCPRQGPLVPVDRNAEDRVRSLTSPSPTQV